MAQPYGPQPSRKMKRASRKKKRQEWVAGLKAKVEKGKSRRRIKKLAYQGKVSQKGEKVAAKEYSRKGMRGQEKAVPGSSKVGKVTKGAVGAVKTKGGTFVKYKKGSKSAKSFQSAFKAGCAGDSKGFIWQGRSYSCAKAPAKKK